MKGEQRDERIVALLGLVRSHQSAKALDEIERLRPSFDEDHRPALDALRRLVRYYLRPERADFANGLEDAITGVAFLGEAGYRPLIAWDFANVGYAMGHLGDMENGIAWMDIAIDDARDTDDRRALIYFLAHKAELLCNADSLDAAHDCLIQARALCAGQQAPLQAGVLTSLSYWRLLKARVAGTPAQEIAKLAEQAIGEAEEALQIMKGTPDFAHIECTTLSNRAQALVLMGRHDEAETVFVEGLSKAKDNRMAMLELLVGHAELMIRDGRLHQAGDVLTEAAKLAPAGRVDSPLDRILRLKIELAKRSGDIGRLETLWERRYQLSRSQHRDRLQVVHRDAQALADLIRAQARARAAQLELRAADVALLQAQLRAEQSLKLERQNLLQELHDGLGSQLATARLSALWGELDRDAVVALLEDCMVDLHLVVDTMNDQEGDLGRSLRQLRNRTQARLSRSDVKLNWQLSVDRAPPLPPSTITQMLRIVQEALSNALRHARATNIQIVCEYRREADELVLSIRDDGVGLPTNRNAEGLTPGTTKGLANMRHRADRLGAILTVQELAPGTEVALRMTLDRTDGVMAE